MELQQLKDDVDILSEIEVNLSRNLHDLREELKLLRGRIERVESDRNAKNMELSISRSNDRCYVTFA